MLRFLLALLAINFCIGQPANWRTPFPAYTIAGNVHYVGTEGLACFLVTTPQGHILINTGFEDSVPLIRSSVNQLGFRFEDIRILLTMQAHGDHVEGFSEIQKLTRAKVFATEGDAPSLEDGGKSDPAFGGKVSFAPVRVDRRLKDGDIVKLGGSELTVILTPGHSKGSVSYAMNVADKGKQYRLLFANMGSVVMPLAGNAKYPEIADDFARSFAKQKTLSPDIWLAAHGEQYNMKEKHKANSFVDPEGYKAAVLQYEKLFQEKLRRP